MWYGGRSTGVHLHEQHAVRNWMLITSFERPSCTESVWSKNLPCVMHVAPSSHPSVPNMYKKCRQCRRHCTVCAEYKYTSTHHGILTLFPSKACQFAQNQTQSNIRIELCRINSFDANVLLVRPCLRLGHSRVFRDGKGAVENADISTIAVQLEITTCRLFSFSTVSCDRK